jgi:hypothetical protein
MVAIMNTGSSADHEASGKTPKGSSSSQMHVQPVQNRDVPLCGGAGSGAGATWAWQGVEGRCRAAAAPAPRSRCPPKAPSAFQPPTRRHRLQLDARARAAVGRDHACGSGGGGGGGGAGRRAHLWAAGGWPRPCRAQWLHPRARPMAPTPSPPSPQPTQHVVDVHLLIHVEPGRRGQRRQHAARQLAGLGGGLVEGQLLGVQDLLHARVGDLVFLAGEGAVVAAARGGVCGGPRGAPEGVAGSCRRVHAGSTTSGRCKGVPCMGAPPGAAPPLACC